VMWTYGPGSRGAARLFRLIASGRLPIIGSGRNTIQPVWLDDAIDALLACARRPVQPGAIYNVAGPAPLSISHLCNVIASATGGSVPRFHIPLSLVSVAAALCERTFPHIGVAPPLDHQKVDFFRVNHAYSIQRAAEELRWEPKIDFPEGSLRMAGWMRERGLL
jgi:nucleoside-diphosphate-sugar epimerase